MVDKSLDLVSERGTAEVPIEPCARELRARLIEDTQPDAAASDLEHGAELAFDRGNVEHCIRLLKHAASLQNSRSPAAGRWPTRC